jgi:hypothetical protein
MTPLWIKIAAWTFDGRGEISSDGEKNILIFNKKNVTALTISQHVQKS